MIDSIEKSCNHLPYKDFGFCFCGKIVYEIKRTILPQVPITDKMFKIFERVKEFENVMD